MKKLLVIVLLILGVNWANAQTTITVQHQGCFSSWTETIVVGDDEQLKLTTTETSIAPSLQEQFIPVVKRNQDLVNELITFTKNNPIKAASFCTSTKVITVEQDGERFTTRMDDCGGDRMSAVIKELFGFDKMDPTTAPSF